MGAGSGLLGLGGGVEGTRTLLAVRRVCVVEGGDGRAGLSSTLLVVGGVLAAEEEDGMVGVTILMDPYPFSSHM